MKYYLVEENGEIKKVGAQGFVPKNVVARVPDKLRNEKKEWLKVVEVTDEDGLTHKEIRIDEDIKLRMLGELADQRTKEKQKEDARLQARERLKDLSKIPEPNTRKAIEDLMITLQVREPDGATVLAWNDMTFLQRMKTSILGG